MVVYIIIIITMAVDRRKPINFLAFREIKTAAVIVYYSIKFFFEILQDHDETT